MHGINVCLLFILEITSFTLPVKIDTHLSKMFLEYKHLGTIID